MIAEDEEPMDIETGAVEDEEMKEKKDVRQSFYNFKQKLLDEDEAVIFVHVSRVP